MNGKLKKLVNRNKLKEVFEYFEKMELSEEQNNMRIMLSSQWNSFKEQQLMGLLNLGEESQVRNKLNFSIIKFINMIE